MNLITVGNKGRTRHYIDVDKCKYLSKAKSLCGKSGKELVRFDAVYFNYELFFPIMCKKCEKEAKKGHDKW
jgi:hypothetical protein